MSILEDIIDVRCQVAVSWTGELAGASGRRRVRMDNLAGPAEMGSR